MKLFASPITILSLALAAVTCSFVIPREIRGQTPEAKQVQVLFTGGHETDPRDHGRPDVLIAAALGVPTEVFREAFSHVTPAGPGRSPEPEEARRNKMALMKVLGPLGITDERLNAVSNYYRYNRPSGQLVWRSTPAIAFASLSNGAIVGFTITDPGSGYSSEPQISVEGMPELRVKATLSFGTDFSRNGSVKELAIVAGK
jgi:hypothetical protein